jgi:hypothetical protein
MLEKPLRQRYFVHGLIFICLTYLGFECFLNAYSMLSVDEFWFAQRTYQYKNNLPYRDFAPYKTVIGYYLLLLPMLVSHSLIDTLIFMKNAITLLNTIILFSTSIWLARFFSSRAILTCLVLLIATDVVLTYSTNIRVDLFAYWFCFFSLLFLLEKKYLCAGILIGLGFGASQKALWYLVASNCALGMAWITTTRDIKTLWSIAKFNIIALLVIGFYIACWSWVAGAQQVLHNIFTEAAAMYHLDWYNKSRQLFWMLTLTYNPLLFLLWPLTLLSLFITYEGDTRYDNRLFITIYAAVILCCLIPYKQVFPYYMQVTIPVFLALYAAFFSWFFDIFQTHQTIKCVINRYYVVTFIAFYVITTIVVITQMALPAPYLLINMIPILFGLYFFNPEKRTANFVSFSFNMITITGIFIGLIYPLTLFLNKISTTNNAYQNANVTVLNILLQDGSDYVAGMDFIYNKSQPIAGMKHLMGPAIDYLAAPSDKLRTVMLASLEQDPRVTAASVISAFEKSAVKYYVNNYRIIALPKNIKGYLTDQFEHLWGSIYIYSPTISSGKTSLYLKFNGKYHLEAPTGSHILLNKSDYTANSIIYLERGHYTSHARKSYRLKLIPDILPTLLNREYQNDDWEKMAL